MVDATACPTATRRTLDVASALKCRVCTMGFCIGFAPTAMVHGLGLTLNNRNAMQRGTMMLGEVMVKVVGEDPQAIKRATCRDCAAVLEYTPSETKERHGLDYTGGADGREYIVCPRCGHEVVLRAW